MIRDTVLRRLARRSTFRSSAVENRRGSGSPRARRDRGLLAFALVTLLLAIGAVPVLAAPTPDEATGESAQLAEPPAPTPAEVAAVEAKRREEEEWLSSPEAAQEREASQEAFAEVSAGQAKTMLVESFPEAMAALNEDPGRVLTELHVEKPLGAHAAIVGNGNGGELRLVETSVPVESEVGGEGRQPVDLTLEQSADGYSPANPITELELPATAEGAIRLHDGLKVRLPADDDHEAVPLGEENLFIPETEPSTDTLLSPVGRGVAISEQLRSVESPDELTFELDPPRGDDLKSSSSGGAEVVSSEGRVVAEVPPPTAVDAQGASVPVEMRVVGDTLIVAVADRGESEFAYPILVDPEIVTEEGYLGFWAESPGEGYHLRELGGSLNAYNEPYRMYGAETHAAWTYTPPGETSFVEAGYFNPVVWYGGCGSLQPHGYIGLYNGSTHSYDGLGVFNASYSESKYETGWEGGPSDRFAAIGIGSGASEVAIPCAHEIYVGGYLIQIADEDAPTWNYAFGPSSWMNETPLPIDVSATDTGLGVKSYVIHLPHSSEGWLHEGTCIGTRASPCPRT